MNMTCKRKQYQLQDYCYLAQMTEFKTNMVERRMKRAESSVTPGIYLDFKSTCCSRRGLGLGSQHPL